MDIQNQNEQLEQEQTSQKNYEGYTGFRPSDAKKPPFELNLGQLFLGLILIFGGLFFLAKNMGWLQINNIPVDWQRFWPVLLVFAGLAMIKTKNFVSTLIGLIATILVFGLVVWVVFGLGFYLGK